MSNLVAGVGINDANYVVKTSVYIHGKKKEDWACPIYRRWVDMITRCYSSYSQKTRPTYIGCSVSDEWQVFSNFSRWMIKQDWKGKHLDKDILLEGNKIYSSEACVFVSAMTNTFMIDQANARGSHPLGAVFQKGKFMARCSNPLTNKKEYLGYFKTELEAHLAWKRRKHELALQLADLQDDPRVASALRTRYAI